MPEYRKEGADYWSKQGIDNEIPVAVYQDYVAAEEYRRVLENFVLQDRLVLNLAAGYPPQATNHRTFSAPTEIELCLKEKNARLTAVDIAEDPLKKRNKEDEEVVKANVFRLPFANESIDGGCVLINFLNAHYKSDGKTFFLTPQEREELLREIFRVLKKDTFLIISNFGHFVFYEGTKKHTPVTESEISTFETIKRIADKLGFSRIEEISLDQQREETATKTAVENLPPQYRDIVKSGKMDLKCDNAWAAILVK